MKRLTFKIFPTLKYRKSKHILKSLMWRTLAYTLFTFSPISAGIILYHSGREQSAFAFISMILSLSLGLLVLQTFCRKQNGKRYGYL